MAADNIIACLEESMIALNRAKTLDLVMQALSQKLDPFSITNAVANGMKSIGKKFARGECFIPELILSSKIFQQVMDMIGPELKGKAARHVKGKVVLGTVSGDLHDLGLKLVSLTLSVDGFDVANLGKDVPVETFLDTVKEHRPDILGLSALLTTTLTQQREVIAALTANNLREKVKVMIGGAPVTQEWAKEIGADAVGFDAIDALQKARELIAP